MRPPSRLHQRLANRAPRTRRLCFTTHATRLPLLTTSFPRRSTPSRTIPPLLCTGDEESCAVEDEDDDAHDEMVPFRPRRDGRIRASAGFVSVSFFSFLFRFCVVFLPFWSLLCWCQPRKCTIFTVLSPHRPGWRKGRGCTTDGGGGLERGRHRVR